jgi:6-phosphogluconate dehydrogenase
MAEAEDKAAQPAEPAAGRTAGRVAFCGLGIMGGPMAANLGDAGFELSVYTRTKEKAER